MRNYAQLNIAIWNDDDFRALTPQAQHLYFLLLSHPTLSYCGVGDWRPKRLASMATGWTSADVQRAGAELIDRLFIVVDEETEEFLVRTFVKNDPLMRQRNLGVSMARAFSLVASEGIRGVIVGELNRLAEVRPELKGLDSDEVRQVLVKPSIDPSVYPCGNPWVDPSVKGSIDPSVDPSVRGEPNPKGDPSIDPSVYPCGNPWVDPSVKGSIDPSVDPSVRGEPNPKGDPSIDPSVDPSPTPAPTPPPLQLRESLEETEDGGKGGSGEKGETNDTDSTGETEPDPPFYDSLDALADAHAQEQTTGRPATGVHGTIDDPRCDKHAGLPADQVPACHACARARQWLETHGHHELQTRARKRREAINACDLCDDNGMYDTGAGLTRCNHQPKEDTPPWENHA